MFNHFTTFHDPPPLHQSQLQRAPIIADVLATLVTVCDRVPCEGAREGHQQWATTSGQPHATPSWNTLLVGCDMFRLLASCLAPSALEDDALLEAVGLVGALAGHAQLAQHLADSGAVRVPF